MDTPIYTPHEAGERLADLARGHDFVTGAGRELFADGLRDLTGVAGGILRELGLQRRESDG